MASISGHIFISYRQQEPDKQFAHRLAYDLQAAGHPVWIDVQGIEAGSNWNTEIQQALDLCYAYVVVLTPESMASHWVRSELLYALREKSGRIYPVMLLDVKPPPDIISIQYVDFRYDYNRALSELLATLPVPPSSGMSPTATQSLKLPDTPVRKALPVWAYGLIGLVAVALVVGLGLLISTGQGGGSGTPTTNPVASQIAEQPTQTPTPTEGPTSTPAATMGGPQTPISFVFYADPVSSGKMLIGSRTITDKLSELTGLTITSSVETTLSQVVASMCTGSAQIGTLTTLSYLLAQEHSCANVLLVAVRSGATTYTSQIVAQSRFAKVTDLKGKRFCRVDALSPTGWIMPSLLLKSNGVNPDTDLAEPIKDLLNHEAVVTAVYNDECDAGGTFSDARVNVFAELPDVNSKVKVLDTTVGIPNDVITVAPGMPADQRAKIAEALVEIAKEPEIGDILRDLNGWTGLQPTDDSAYDAFRLFFGSTGYKIEDFVK